MVIKNSYRITSVCWFTDTFTILYVLLDSVQSENVYYYSGTTTEWGVNHTGMCDEVECRQDCVTHIGVWYRRGPQDIVGQSKSLSNKWWSFKNNLSPGFNLSELPVDNSTDTGVPEHSFFVFFETERFISKVVFPRECEIEKRRKTLTSGYLEAQFKDDNKWYTVRINQDGQNLFKVEPSVTTTIKFWPPVKFRWLVVHVCHNEYPLQNSPEDTKPECGLPAPTAVCFNIYWCKEIKKLPTVLIQLAASAVLAGSRMVIVLQLLLALLICFW